MQRIQVGFNPAAFDSFITVQYHFSVVFLMFLSLVIHPEYGLFSTVSGDSSVAVNYSYRGRDL